MMIEIILAIIILLLLTHYLFFLLKIFFGLKKVFPQTSENYPDELISIIVPFRNEEENIARTYNNLVNQNYNSEKFEILFINDLSEDNSLEILESLPVKQNVRIFTVPNDYSVTAHKKRAIRFGIEQAGGEIIVTTDADCLHKPDWLKNLVKFFDDETAFISGPVEFISDGSLFSKMQRLEFAGLVITGAGLIGAGAPTICNAANIAYRREAFNEVGGFLYQMSLSSGDDELLMQKIHRDTKYKIKFALDRNAIVATESNPDLKSFYYQRKRWASKGLFYGDHSLLLKLILIFLFYLSLIIQPILGLLLSDIFFFTFTVSFLLKLFFEFLVIKRGADLLFNKDIIKPFFITEILQVPYILISGFMGIFGNLTWKNRKIKR